MTAAAAGSAPLAAAPDGERWGAFVLDRTSRFIVAWASGPRDERLAYAVVSATRDRTAGRAGVRWVSDGWTPYAAAIMAVYWDDRPATGLPWTLRLPAEGVALTQAVKHRKGRRLERLEVRAVLGEAADLPYTVQVERQNGVLRDRLACLTRKTHAFAKRVATWTAAFSLTLFAQNWVRPHPALRLPLVTVAARPRYEQRTPAMVQGLTDHPWPLVEVLTRPVRHSY